MLLTCLGTFGGTVMPFVGLGGYPTINSLPQYGNASALVITYVINNHKDEALNVKAEAWEQAVIDYMRHNFSDPSLIVSYSTERSINDELARESNSDVKTILISYMAMFLYITLTLGRFRVFEAYSSGGGGINGRGFFARLFATFESIMIDMKFCLGIAGVVIVLASVAASVGFFSFFKVKATLIIFEVIPFLVLAVGVDNIFILVQNYQRDTRLPGETLEQQIGRIVGRVGPSMLLTSSSEVCLFNSFKLSADDSEELRKIIVFIVAGVLVGRAHAHAGREDLLAVRLAGRLHRLPLADHVLRRAAHARLQTRAVQALQRALLHSRHGESTRRLHEL